MKKKKLKSETQEPEDISFSSDTDEFDEYTDSQILRCIKQDLV